MSKEKLLVINSRDRKSGTSAEFELFFNDSACQQVAKILVKEIYVPNQFQNITLDNHRIEFIQTTVFPTPQIVTIPTGQYNIDQLIAALKTGIDAKLTSGTTIAITKSDTLYNLKFTFSGSATPGDNNVIIYWENSTIRDIIGLESTNIPASNIITMGNPYNLRTIDFVQIHSPQLAEAHGLDGGANGYISLLETVSLTTTGYGGVAYRQNNDDELASILYEQPRNLSRINIVLRDDLGNKLTLPSNTHMTIMIKIYF
jgi:hypothetical protein